MERKPIVSLYKHVNSISDKKRQRVIFALVCRGNFSSHHLDMIAFVLAQALLANMVAMYCLYHGRQGLRNIATNVHKLTCDVAGSQGGNSFETCIGKSHFRSQSRWKHHRKCTLLRYIEVQTTDEFERNQTTSERKTYQFTLLRRWRCK